MPDLDIRSAVREALDNALANDSIHTTAWGEALSLVCYDADLEHLQPEELLPHVVEWRRENGYGDT